MKLHFILQTITDSNIDIACITESWLTEGYLHTASVLKSFGFNLSHTYRTKRKGGGVAFLLKNKFTFKKISTQLIFVSFEWHGLRLFTNRVYLMICIYRKQEIPLAVFITEATELMSKLCNTTSDTIVVTGDFNVHFESGNKSCQDIRNMFLQFGLQQQSVNDATHIGGHTLDLIFTNPCELALSGTVCQELSVSENPQIKFDHFPILFQLPIYDLPCEPSQIVTKSSRHLKAINNDEFQCYLGDQLVNSQFSTVRSFSEKLYVYNQCLSSTLDKFAPLKTMSIRNNSCADPEWIDQEYRTERRKRRFLEKQWKRTKTEESHLQYVQQRDSCVLLANFKQKQYFSNLIASTNNPSTLFKTVSKLWNKTENRCLPEHNGDLKALANDFNNFFVEKVEKIHDSFSHTSHPLPLKTTDAHSNDENNHLNFDPLHTFKLATLDELKDIASDMIIKTSFDDPLPASVLKPSLDTVLPYMLELVNTSLSTGNISGLKESTITPLLKKIGLDLNKHTHYRPLFNLQFLSKLIEKVVLNRLTDHMSVNNLHCPKQFGYKKHHSSETLLLEIVDDTLIGFDKNSATVMILLDMSAAFDTVDLHKLLKILEHKIGLRGTVLNWFKSFLLDRKQKVKVNGIISDVLLTLYGVPQGSVLGPVLFNIYVSSLSSVFKNLGTLSSSYADDTNTRIKLSLQFQYHNISCRIPQLLKDVNKWMGSHFLKLNTDKTKIIFLHPTNLKSVVKIKGFFYENQCIRFSDVVKLLGVYIDENLTFDEHVSTIVSSSFYHLSNIAKIRRYLSQADTEKLIHALISTKLDYCNSLLFGVKSSTLASLQSVQNRAARIVLGLKSNASVTDNMLKDLHWLKIEERIVYKILLLTHKFFINCSPAYFNERLIIINHDERLLNVWYHTSVSGRRSFSYAAPRLWNCLPQEMRLLNNTDMFKSRIKTVLFTNMNNIMQASLGYRTYY